MTTYKKWQTTASKYLVDDRWLKLRADSCVTPDGQTLDPFYIFEYADWVNCLVIDDDDNAVMIRQYRHGAKEYVLEIIGGGVSPGDTDAEMAIRRELQEEIGYSGGEVIQTGVSYANPANQTNKIYSFLAFDGSLGKEQALEPGENIHIEKMPLSDVLRLMTNASMGEIFQSNNLANLLFALNYIKTSDHPRLQALRNLI